ADHAAFHEELASNVKRNGGEQQDQMFHGRIPWSPLSYVPTAATSTQLLNITSGYFPGSDFREKVMKNIIDFGFNSGKPFVVAITIPFTGGSRSYQRN
ncbi:MAG: hypothetical protein ACREBU_09280, partial [Nitrososphaera sp.]